MSKWWEMPEIPAGAGKLELRRVRSMDDRTDYYFLARSNYEALLKMRYMLSLKDSSAGDLAIQMTLRGGHIYLVHNGETYATATD